MRGIVIGNYDGNSLTLMLECGHDMVMSNDSDGTSEDVVNNPAHYQSADGIECIDAIRAALGDDQFKGYLRGNAMKYVWRAGKKNPDKAAEDMAKAAWYANKYKELYGEQ